MSPGAMSGRGRWLAPAAVALLLGLTVGPLRAEPEAVPDYAGATLVGDPGGRRSAAWQAGWAFDAALRVDALRNRGGLNNGGGAMSNLDLRVEADLGRIAGWSGTTAYLHVLDNRGAGVNARHTGSLMGSSNIEVPVPTARVFQAWLQQSFLDEQFSLLFGLYPVDTEFFVMDSASLLVHPSFGTPADLAMTRGPSIFNNAALGLRGKWQSADRAHYALAAVLDGVPNDPEHPRRTTVDLSHGDGAFVIGELGWLPQEDRHLFAPARGGASEEKYDGVSKYAVGYWRYTRRVPDLLAANAESRSQGAYLLAERTLFGLGEAGRDVSLFARYSLADGDTTPISRSWNIGARWRGPLASRADDVLAIGWTYSHLAGKYRAAQAAGGTATATGEAAVELSWRAAVTPYFAVQPVVQSIRHPGGAAAARRATVFGVRLDLVL